MSKLFAVGHIRRSPVQHSAWLQFCQCIKAHGIHITAPEHLPFLIHITVDIRVYTLSGSFQVIFRPYGHPRRGISEKMAREGGSERLRVTTLNFRLTELRAVETGYQNPPRHHLLQNGLQQNLTEETSGTELEID